MKQSFSHGRVKSVAVEVKKKDFAKKNNNSIEQDVKENTSFQNETQYQKQNRK